MLCHDCDKDPNNCYWIQYLIILVSLVTWFQLCTDILVCLPIPNIAQYLNMFQYVSRTYLHIIGCFLPFMAFFAVCFKSKDNTDKMIVQRKLDLADTDLAENLDLKDTPQKIWATIFDFYYVSLLEIAENLVPF